MASQATKPTVFHVRKISNVSIEFNNNKKRAKVREIFLKQHSLLTTLDNNNRTVPVEKKRISVIQRTNSIRPSTDSNVTVSHRERANGSNQLHGKDSSTSIGLMVVNEQSKQVLNRSSGSKVQIHRVSRSTPSLSGGKITPSDENSIFRNVSSSSINVSLK